jgi:hypothetical protein
MIMKNYFKLGVLIATFFHGGLGLQGVAQNLPNDFISKVQYYEHKAITYELINSEGFHCLTLRERSQFHGYSQLYEMVELVDQEGDLLTDKVFIDEQNVRDEWMEDFSRITVAKDSIYVYGEDDSVFYSMPSDSDKVYLSAQQAMDYGLVKMDNGFYEELALELMKNNFVVQNQGNRLIAHSDMVSIFMDKSTQVSGVTVYDSSGNKVEEQTMKYAAYSQEDLLFYPQEESVIEWFWSENGCCVRRATTLRRFGFQKAYGPSVSEPYRQQNPESNRSEEQDADVKILVEQNSSAFRIVSHEYKNQPLEVVLYDMKGKEILKKEVSEGSRIEIPHQSRAGMYLVHLKYKNRHLPISGKIIKPNSSKSF